ncbi:SDR family NAD(P)-dependent oxidoreductase [Streptosporangium sp. NPDC049644]|uniref:SDR family NAD(P)-dependent oxidoreductase n=1 Tax=Streptosporangium sp. NPDC049644 TaxID=3155507 RepID=UPI00342791BF
MSDLSRRIAQLPDDRRERLADRLKSAADTVASEPIAVIGLSCRLPGGADSPEALWRLLVEGRDAVREGPHERWDVDAFYDEDPDVPGRTTSRWAGYLDDIAGFDAAFFGITAREAAAMDPQHRLLLEVAWESLEHAGIPPDGLTNSRTGVFAGLSHFDYALRMTGRYTEMNAYTGTGNVHSTAVGRISYLLGLVGPSIAVDTACSSSLVAIHLACQSLRLRESDLALAGGVNLLIRPEDMIVGSQWGMFSPRGRCHPFDTRADGFVRGEGAGVVVLKRLTDALRDGDRVLAVVRGSAVNQDGRSQGMTAPSPAAQRAVLRAALDIAGVDPAEVGLIETHGTGTPLGDPIEFAALADVYGGGPHRCALGAVKSNLGHTESAAGVTGFVKAVLCLWHGLVPPNLHFDQWNPTIPGEDSRFFVPTGLSPWPAKTATRLASLSSFGMSGTNAHAVLEQAPEVTHGHGGSPAPGQVREKMPEVSMYAVPERGWKALPEHATDAVPEQARGKAAGGDRDRVPAVVAESGRPFPLSAGSPAALAAAARKLAEALRTGDVRLTDVAHTLALRRSHRQVRLCTVAATREELVARLDKAAAGEPDHRTARGSAGGGSARGAVWVFPGQGSQWAGMGRGLLATEPAFAAAIGELEPLIAAEAGFSVIMLLREGRPITALDRLQPALFAVQYALAATWRSHGVEPVAVIGHSLGEVTAAVVSGALSLADGVRVVCRRSQLMAGIAGAGAMALVERPAEQLMADLPGTVSVAVLASPRSTVVSGAAAEVEQLVTSWREHDLPARLIEVDVASHSPEVDPILDDLADRLADLAPRPARIRWYSTVTDDPRGGSAPDAAHWVANLRRPVLFSGAVAAAADDGHTVFVEVSPHPVLVHAITETLDGRSGDHVVLPTLRRGQDEPEAVTLQLAALYCAGVSIDWTRRYGAGGLVDLPTTTWDRRRHWIDLPLPHPDDQAVARVGRPPAITADEIAPLLYETVWESVPLADVPSSGVSGRWIVLGEDGDLAEQVGRTLRAAGASCSVFDLDTGSGPAYSPGAGGGELPAAVSAALGAIDSSCRGVVVLVGTAFHGSETARGDLVDRSAGRLSRVLRLIQAGADGVGRSASDQAPRLWMVTRGAQAIFHGDEVALDQGALRGLVRTAMYEYPELRPTIVDLDPALLAHGTLAEQIVGEVLAESVEGEIAWRDGERRVALLVGLSPENEARSATRHVRPDGSYVITGGLGALGLEMAGWLTERGAGRIVLNGRTAPSEHAEKVITRLRAAGTSVEVVLGDIAEPGVAERLVAIAAVGGSPLRGVVHAAGVVSAGLIAELDTDMVYQTWRPKALGAWRLHEATDGHELDWFVLFSSLSALVGGLGIGAYAATNAWLDSFADWRRARGLKALSVAWGQWRGLGMAARLSSRDYAAISVQEGVTALETLLDHDRARAGVFRFNPEDLAATLPSAVDSRFFAATPVHRHDTAGSGTVRARLMVMETGERHDAMSAYLGELIRVALGMAVAAEPHRSLASLGFDSLIALQLRNQLEFDLAMKISATTVWAFPTTAALAGHLLERMESPADDTSQDSPTPEHRDAPDSPLLEQSPDSPSLPSRQQAGEWFPRYLPRPEARVRLYCFPHLAGTASAYRPWGQVLPSFAELTAVQLPGREERGAEPPVTDLRVLAATLAEALAADRDRRQFAFFGHSSGGLLAFETARALRRFGHPAPVLLAVSAMGAPQDPRWARRLRDHLPERPLEALAGLDGVAAEVLRDPQLTARLLPVVEADAALYGSYLYTEEPPLDCPISVFGGEQDQVYDAAELQLWEAQTTVGLVRRSYPGGHFYLRVRLDELITDLAADLVAALAATKVGWASPG